jgi:WD repeat-containing protein 68
VFKIPGDDHQALIWDIQQMPRPIEDPILAYTAAEGAINQVNINYVSKTIKHLCVSKTHKTNTFKQK